MKWSDGTMVADKAKRSHHNSAILQTHLKWRYTQGDLLQYLWDKKIITTDK
jgi:hypothetical protein